MTTITLSELSQLARDLAGLLRLGYPTVEAVQKVSASYSPTLGAILERTVLAQQRGESLAASLEKEPAVLPLFVRLLDCAEKSEALPAGLERAAGVMDDLAVRRSRCFLASLYPCLVVTIVMLLLWLICVAGGGMLANLFESMSLALPWPTRLLLALSTVGKHPLGLLVFMAPLVLLWLVVFGRTGWNWSVYRLPLFGPWLLRQEAVIYLKTVGHLVELGTPLVQATKLAVDACSMPLRGRLSEVSSRLEAGDPLSKALTPTGVFPELALWAIERREQTESLRLLSIGDFMDRELELTMERGLVLFEPLVFVGVLFAIGFVVLAVFLPLYQLLGNL
jgi:type II secretory pathway component PulF